MEQFKVPTARFAIVALPEDVLLEEYRIMLKEDPAVREEALKAAVEMKGTAMDDLDSLALDIQRKNIANEGKVSRRAPGNPFHSPMLGKFKTGGINPQAKVDDPALERNPLRGRLVVTIGVNAALFLLFCQSLVMNRCVYGSFYAPRSENSNIGPGGQALFDMGGLNANAIRKDGQWIRIFWSMWMHSGWIHIMFNVLCQLQFFYMLEPDWGAWRTLVTFFVAGLTGNVMSVILDPCKTTVGSSGGLFGLMGGIIPYCVEFWHSIPRPMCILIFSVVTVCLTLLTSLTKSTDTWAHVGGFLGGLLFGFGTITSPAAFLPKERVLKRQVQTNKYVRFFQNFVDPECKCGPREWTIRLASLSVLILLWTLCFVYLFHKYDYQPLGSLTYGGITHCCCCYDWSVGGESLEVRELWHCGPCDYPAFQGSPILWGEFCEKQRQ